MNGNPLGPGRHQGPGADLARCPEFRSATTATPCRSDFAIPSFMACSPKVWPNPNSPSPRQSRRFEHDFEDLVRLNFAGSKPINIRRNAQDAVGIMAS